MKQLHTYTFGQEGHVAMFLLLLPLVVVNALVNCVVLVLITSDRDQRTYQLCSHCCFRWIHQAVVLARNGRRAVGTPDHEFVFLVDKYEQFKGNALQLISHTRKKNNADIADECIHRMNLWFQLASWRFSRSRCCNFEKQDCRITCRYKHEVSKCNAQNRHIWQ